VGAGVDATGSEVFGVVDVDVEVGGATTGVEERPLDLWPPDEYRALIAFVRVADGRVAA
jgi:hypothetical protein